MHSPAPDEQQPPAGGSTPAGGPPELQHLLQRMERDEEQATGEEPPEGGPPQIPPAGPELSPPDSRRACVTLFLTIVILPALIFGPGLPYPSNVMALASTGGLLLVLAYLDWTGRGRWMALIPVIIALLLFLHATGLVVLARQGTG